MEDILSRIKEIMAIHIGRKNAISSGEIARILGLKEEDTHAEPRYYILESMKKYRIPIAAGGKGYYLIENEIELERYLNSLNNRIQEIENRGQLVKKAFQQYYGNNKP
jgi:hypothetical protein